MTKQSEPYDALVEIGFQRGLDAVRDAVRTVMEKRNLLGVDAVIAAIDALGTEARQTCKDHKAIEKEHERSINWPPHDCTGKAGERFAYDVTKMPKCVRCGKPTSVKMFTDESEHPCDNCGFGTGKAGEENDRSERC